jgi:C-terminal processing protease CtpA/Prc
VQQASGSSVGDVILAVDGEDIVKRRERLGKIYAASTPQALAWRIHRDVLRGADKSLAKLKVKNKDGKMIDLSVPRSMPFLQNPRRTLVFSVLPSGFGYVDLARLTVPQVDSALEVIKGTPGVIFDMRGYPNGTAWPLAPRLAEKKAVTARFQRPEWHGPDTTEVAMLQFYQTVEPSEKWRYAGKVVVLINEEAISQAEHTCMYLEAATEVTFIGTPTNGANGDVTTTVLPGGITVNFTGHDVRHGDGRQLQRLGIQPHIRIEPTIAGIRNGRDEVLERAVEFLRKTTK